MFILYHNKFFVGNIFKLYILNLFFKKKNLDLFIIFLIVIKCLVLFNFKKVFENNLGYKYESVYSYQL